MLFSFYDTTRRVKKLFTDWFAWKYGMQIFRSSWNKKISKEDMIEVYIVQS